jgi:hypothetical protein
MPTTATLALLALATLGNAPQFEHLIGRNFAAKPRRVNDPLSRIYIFGKNAHDNDTDYTCLRVLRCSDNREDFFSLCRRLGKRSISQGSLAEWEGSVQLTSLY